MDYSKPWGWSPSKTTGPLSNLIAPLASSPASAAPHLTLPEDPMVTAGRAGATAAASKAIDNFMKPGAATQVQDSATKAALYSDAGYGAPLGAGTAEVAQAASTEVAADAAQEAATEVAKGGAEAALSGASSVIPYAGVAASVAEGEYVQAAAEAAATSMFGPLAGKAAKYATKWIGLADGTTGVQARAAAGARFAPELFGGVSAQGGKGGTAPSGGRMTAPVRPPRQRATVVAPVRAPMAPAPSTAPTYTETWDNPNFSGGY